MSAAMNSKQTKTLIWGAAIVGVMLLVPPWVFIGESIEPVGYGQLATKVTRVNGPYAFLPLGAPAVPPDVVAKHRTNYLPAWRAEVDWIRYLIPVGVAAFAVAGRVIFMRGRQEGPLRDPDLENYKNWKQQQPKG